METINHLISYKEILWFLKSIDTTKIGNVSYKIWKQESNDIYKKLHNRSFVSVNDALAFFEKYKIITNYDYELLSHAEYVYALQAWKYSFDYNESKWDTFSCYIAGKESNEAKDYQIINEFIEPLAKIITDTYQEHRDNNINKFSCNTIIDRLNLEEPKDYFWEWVLATELLLYHIYINDRNKILEFLAIIKNSTEVKTDLLEDLYNQLRKVQIVFSSKERSAFEDKFQNNIYIFEDIEFNLTKNTCKIWKYTIDLQSISNKNFDTKPSCSEDIHKPITAIKFLFGVVKYYCNHIKKGSKIHIEMMRDDSTYENLKSYTKTFCSKYSNLWNAWNLNTDNLWRISNLLKKLWSKVLAQQKNTCNLRKGSWYQLILSLKQ
jgi:hypothetical protein